MQTVLFIFPHQLFRAHSGLKLQPDIVVLIEGTLFFKDKKYPVNFHRQKLLLHRSSMKCYQDYLKDLGINVRYADWQPDLLKDLFQNYKDEKIIVMDPSDYELERRLENLAGDIDCEIEILESQLFINSRSDNANFGESKDKWLMAQFYKFQRRRLKIMIDDEGEPDGGKWSFDSDNRKKIPKKELDSIPDLSFPVENKYVTEAKSYIKNNFPDAIGNMDKFYYPINFEEADCWLEDFLNERFALFGPYEDALVPSRGWLYHSVLTPMLNIGLLEPEQIITKALEKYDDDDSVPIASVEGFVRQIIGWREFMRATYEDLGIEMRNGNSWDHKNDLPECFYDGSTGIKPVDDVIQRVLDTGYCHHIERLMVLGGFMFLCEIEPKQIYKWFMEVFIDSYDWVMVPNVYAMSQNADGGLITTKPYFSGSAYLKKMGYSELDEWTEIWDGLYWRWIIKNSAELSKNHRWAMMCSMASKMDKSKRKKHLQVSENFLEQLFK